MCVYVLVTCGGFQLDDGRGEGSVCACVRTDSSRAAAFQYPATVMAKIDSAIVVTLCNVVQRVCGGYDRSDVRSVCLALG